MFFTSPCSLFRSPRLLFWTFFKSINRDRPQWTLKMFETMYQFISKLKKCWKRGNAMSLIFDMLTHRVWKKIHPTHLFYITIFHPPRLFKSPRLIFLNNFLPTTFIQDPTFIRDIRVLVGMVRQVSDCSQILRVLILNRQRPLSV